MKKLNNSSNEKKMAAMHLSDLIRLSYIRSPPQDNAGKEPPLLERLLDIWDGYDDLLYIHRAGNEIIYYEGWVDSCWEALFEKEAYENLFEEEAIDKFMYERFSVIADVLGMKIKDYIFASDILKVTLIPLDTIYQEQP